MTHAVISVFSSGAVKPGRVATETGGGVEGNFTYLTCNGIGGLWASDGGSLVGA